MKYELNTIVATLINKEDAPKGSVGAVIGIKEGKTEKENQYLLELFTVKNHIHDQIWFSSSEFYKIQ